MREDNERESEGIASEKDEEVEGHWIGVDRVGIVVAPSPPPRVLVVASPLVLASSPLVPGRTITDPEEGMRWGSNLVRGGGKGQAGPVLFLGQTKINSHSNSNLASN